MAIDTLVKRNSALSFSTLLLPVPDGTIDQADRQTMAFSYGGILSGIAAVVAGFGSLTKPLVSKLVEPLTQKLAK